jgi:DNA-directed RNA polymerase subunit M/transcription elongation factor TFIIS
MQTKPFLVCRTCGGLIVTGTKNHVEGRLVCNKCLVNNKINAEAYMRISNYRKKTNEINRIAKANI